jgi:desulfoferrodoxin-like iron-binding protein
VQGLRIEGGGDDVRRRLADVLRQADGAGVNQLGKRYQCAVCGQVILCLAGGSGEFTCHEQPMEAVPPQQLPSGD